MDDVREAVAMPMSAHPLAVTVAEDLQNVQGKLRKRVAPRDQIDRFRKRATGPAGVLKT